MMPIVALSPSFTVFVAARALLTFALQGEWSLGSMLVAETWPAHLRRPRDQHQSCHVVFRRLVCRRDHRARRWDLGVARGDNGTGYHRSARGIRPRDVSRSPYWVGGEDRRRRIADTLAAGGTLSAEDRAWYSKADKIGIRQVFMPDVLPATLVGTFVACCSCCIYGTVGAWMPLYLSTEKHWSTAEYSTFYVFWGLVGFFGLCAAGWLADKMAGA